MVTTTLTRENFLAASGFAGTAALAGLARTKAAGPTPNSSSSSAPACASMLQKK